MLIIQWTFAHNESSWTIMSNLTQLYLAPATSPPINGTLLVAASEPFVWDIYPDSTNASNYKYGFYGPANYTSMLMSFKVLRY